ncbi:AlbA family DNA-binding domain-containing protein [Pseudoalteromonas sp. T1lg65]|uniref:AlbA family DNA-binding domain-containing protein n=1 Tax=Pseudoalteromonas sp. T1lg65 TaxID=2077101 RepID=UPI003F793FEB
MTELREGNELECKKSKKDLPKDFWETYSAFANTNGGTVLLGVEELGDGTFQAVGVTM